MNTMNTTNTNIQFIDKAGSFYINQPENISALYFPLASETGLKSAITPNLGGDCKLDQERFLLEPTSVENLHNNRSGRNFWCVVNQKDVYSAAGASASQEAVKFTDEQDDSQLQAGLMWHTLLRTSRKLGLQSTLTSFIPCHDNVEIMHVTLQNTSDKEMEITAYAAIPIYGRSADNLRDHRHVTSLLHRIHTTQNGVFVCPTMSFDERGHRQNEQVYYVCGTDGEGNLPQSFFPTVETFIGEGGTFTCPRAVYENQTGVAADTVVNGKEAMGALQFPTRTLRPQESCSYIVLLGSSESQSACEAVCEKYRTDTQIYNRLHETKMYWKETVNIDVHTGDDSFDGFLKWVSFQPYLRRLFGCSFLPHHDYGRGGRGWRDLWQDCLSLLLMDPHDVGKMIRNNYAGVRIDGTNATIIGSGEIPFIADRNGISRVWMDHALWPLITTKLYIDQTGDLDILNSKVPYFKDAQSMRATTQDSDWNDAYGNQQRTVSGDVYQGSILEHLLIQHLTAFYEVGAHNIYQLRGADWNDALDMADENGESVAFTCAYAGNLRTLADLLRKMDSPKVTLLSEIELLLNVDGSIYDDTAKKLEALKNYTYTCMHQISGDVRPFSTSELADNLTEKADWLMAHLRKQEWMDISDDEGWFNSYYDNHGNAVEGKFGDQIRMMLTGQVFAIMGGVATDEQIQKIITAADHYLYQKEAGGYRLNTDFQELKFDLGRMFGFAYGEKENGAVFSHMTVMYAYALYQRGFAAAGWKALKTLADTALNFQTSCIYPGIPEYFRADGRGMYHYLTGAASWYLLTMITEVFGIRGSHGDLTICPKLLAEQFDEQNLAHTQLTFGGKHFSVTYLNPDRKDYGAYTVTGAICDGMQLPIIDGKCAVLSKEQFASLSNEVHDITITLSATPA